jgi:hypothetical protein
MSTPDFTPSFLLKKNVDQDKPAPTRAEPKARVEPKLGTAVPNGNGGDLGPEFAIPTLESVAVPERFVDVDRPLLAPVLIGPEIGGLSLGGLPPEAQLSNEDIRHITEKLRAVLLPEIEKAVSFSMNHAFALAMDQATHVLRQKLQVKLNEMLPKLVEDAIKHPLRKR